MANYWRDQFGGIQLDHRTEQIRCQASGGGGGEEVGRKWRGGGLVL